MHSSLPMPLVLLSVLTLAVVIRFVVDRLDRQRIRQDVDARGGEVDDITWKPFGRGWFGEKSDRVYEVAWHDAARQPHVAWCKTSMWSGVFWSEDAPGSGKSRDTAALEAENARLRAEVERLKRRGA